MSLRIPAIAIVVLAVTVFSGCKKEPPPPAAPAEVKITEENLDTELDKMEQEINADIATEEQ